MDTRFGLLVVLSLSGAVTWGGHSAAYSAESPRPVNTPRPAAPTVQPPAPTTTPQRPVSPVQPPAPTVNTPRPVLPPVPKPQMAEGVIRRVDGVSMALGLGGEDGKALVLRIARAQVVRNGRPAKPGDLQPGDRARVQYLAQDGGAAAQRIEAQSLCRIRGLLSAVDDAGYVTITPPGSARGLKLKVNDGTKIRIDGKEAGFADLVPELLGSHAGAIYEREGNAAVARLLVVMTETREPPVRPAASSE